jgi:hypothetical protein
MQKNKVEIVFPKMGTFPSFFEKNTVFMKMSQI